MTNGDWINLPGQQGVNALHQQPMQQGLNACADQLYQPQETRMPIDIPDRVERARLEALQRASYIASDADGLLIVAAKIEAWLLRPVGAEAPSPPSAPQESA